MSQATTTPSETTSSDGSGKAEELDLSGDAPSRIIPDLHILAEVPSAETMKLVQQAKAVRRALRVHR